MRLKEFGTGNYYLKVFNSSGTNYIAFNGNLNDVSKVNITESLDNPPKRKNIILLNNGRPLDINLEVLDNYVSNIKYFPETSIINLGLILRIIGFKCTDILIFEVNPFNKIIKNINDVDIGYIYY